MSGIVSVRCSNYARAERYLANNIQVEVGDQVVVKSREGERFGIVSSAKRPQLESESGTIEGVLCRIASPEDIAKAKQNEIEEAEAFKVCRDLIDARNLEMHLVSAAYTHDEGKLIFYFTADGRIDFRDLVRELATEFRTRIELRQIGVRDDAKMNGGMGVCGRELCCSSWMEEFTPVSIRMAKEQNISMNPTNVSGACGRLLCCLHYENDAYRENKKLLPRPGSYLDHDGQKVRVAQQDILGLRLTVQAENSDGTRGDTYTIDAEEVGYGEAKRKGKYEADYEKGDIKKQRFISKPCGGCCSEHSEENASDSRCCQEQGWDLSDNTLVASQDYEVYVEEHVELDKVSSEVQYEQGHEQDVPRRPRYIILEDEE